MNALSGIHDALLEIARAVDQLDGK
jgi:hypothetical protein